MMKTTPRKRAEAWLLLVERKVVYHEVAVPTDEPVSASSGWVPVTEEIMVDAGKAHYEYSFIHDVDAAELVWQLCHDVLYVDKERRYYKLAAKRLERMAKRAMGLTKSQWVDFLNHVGP